MRTNDEKIYPLISIIVANWNSIRFRKLLDEFFESVFNLEYPNDRYEVIVVDNGSKDSSYKYIKEKYHNIKLIKLDKNYGFTKANNIGASFSRGEFLALINNDTVLEKNWLIEMVKYASKNADNIYCSNMLRYDKRDIISFNGGKLLSWGWTYPMQCYEEDKSNESNPILSFYADGCGTLISKKLFFALGGFDEDYHTYCEDYSLSWKAQLQGHKIYCIPTSKFYHNVSTTMGSRSLFTVYLLWRNRLRNMIKYPEIFTLLTMLPIYVACSIVTIVMIYLYQERNVSLIYPIVKAHIHVLLEFPKLLMERRIIQKDRKITDKELADIGLMLSFSESIRMVFKFLKYRTRFLKGIKK